MKRKDKASELKRWLQEEDGRVIGAKYLQCKMILWMIYERRCRLNFNLFEVVLFCRFLSVAACNQLWAMLLKKYHIESLMHVYGVILSWIFKKKIGRQTYQKRHIEGQQPGAGDGRVRRRRESIKKNLIPTMLLLWQTEYSRVIEKNTLKSRVRRWKENVNKEVL